MPGGTFPGPPVPGIEVPKVLGVRETFPARPSQAVRPGADGLVSVSVSVPAPVPVPVPVPGGRPAAQ
ncbi:hypothetical protein H696_04458 [Fonticula alba]|uniref:Uncharacterized protein n=1 Tax=Fonticula alba TaxID=691883 RepID=A0A058Z550_FONAL|nr:hypothetical protein H696_04458 [Fonticula alba]KCV69038.1 hypothetical protein H696_04458 [Fonticula alba]|eukprot:XP_009496609.1 hypothetical protein H696_04458 [Fonticula alba]